MKEALPGNCPGVFFLFERKQQATFSPVNICKYQRFFVHLQKQITKTIYK